MALLGGGVGGAGNPVGGSFTGPAEALEIIGNHGYAYSGVIAAGGAGSADATMLKFTTGNFYTIQDLYWGNDQASSSDTYFEFKLNGAIVYTNKHGRTDDADKIVFSMLIPPYTECEFKMGIGGGGNMTLNTSGRIYRTRD